MEQPGGERRLEEERGLPDLGRTRTGDGRWLGVQLPAHSRRTTRHRRAGPAGGNNVVVVHAPEELVLYAHFKKGTVPQRRVPTRRKSSSSPNAIRVKAGQILGHAGQLGALDRPAPAHPCRHERERRRSGATARVPKRPGAKRGDGLEGLAAVHRAERVRRGDGGGERPVAAGRAASGPETRRDHPARPRRTRASQDLFGGSCSVRLSRSAGSTASMPAARPT